MRGRRDSSDQGFLLGHHQAVRLAAALRLPGSRSVLEALGRHAEACWCPWGLQSCNSSPQEQQNLPGHARAQLFSRRVRGKGLYKEILRQWRERIWGTSGQLSFLLMWRRSAFHSTLNSCSGMDLVLAVPLHRKMVEWSTLGYPHVFTVPSRSYLSRRGHHLCEW